MLRQHALGCSPFSHALHTMLCLVVLPAFLANRVCVCGGGQAPATPTHPTQTAALPSLHTLAAHGGARAGLRVTLAAGLTDGCGVVREPLKGLRRPWGVFFGGHWLLCWTCNAPRLERAHADRLHKLR